MDTKTFLEAVLPPEGPYCIFAARASDERRVQKFYTTLDVVVDAANGFNGDGFDVYFALASLVEAKNRKVDNVSHLGSLFLDLDCGPMKEYATQAEAFTSLKDFCKVLKLPKPLIINSGRGVHVYWPLSEPVALVEWLPIAERLKFMCKKHGLKADPAVTSDAARVLRVVNTHNYKTDPPTLVEPFHEQVITKVGFDTFSELLGGESIPAPKKYTPPTNNSVTDLLHQNMQSNFKDILGKTMAGRGCDQLRSIVLEQETTSEPMWRAGLSIAKFCSDADKAAHLISRKHAGYTALDTAEKLNLIKGPYLCSTFDQHNPNVCPKCPNWGKVKSPITLGNRVREADKEETVEAPAVNLPNAPKNKYVIPTYPRPYFRGASGGVYYRTTNNDGDIDEKCLYHNDLYVVRRLRDPEMGEAIVMRLHLPKDGVREFTVPLTAVTSRDEFRKYMSMQGVGVAKPDDLMQYTITWVNEMQATSMADEAHTQFGWADDDANSFILGNQQVFADRVEFNPPSTGTVSLFPAFEPRGDLESWKKEVVGFYERDDLELHQYVFGVAFGSPLVQFTPINCATMHIHSKDSGVGKTTTLKAALTLYGNPDELMLQERDTYNIKMNRAERLRSVMLGMDEITNTPSKQLSDIAYQFTSGKQRGRMTSSANVERHRGGSWKLLAVTTGNTSIIERISITKAAPKAEAQRILEVKVGRKLFDTKEETDVLGMSLENNYGLAAIPYLQWVMQNKEQVKQMLAKTQARVDQAAGLTAENRFWSVHVACTLTGLIIAKKMGLIDFDIEKIYKWALGMVKNNKIAATDMNSSVEETLNDYFSENWGSFLWIKSTDDLRGNTERIIPEIMPRGQLVGRYETDVKKAYLIPKPLKAWCAKQQINYSSFIEDINVKLGGSKKKMRLSKGTHLNLPPTQVIVVDFAVEGQDAEDTETSPFAS